MKALHALPPRLPLASAWCRFAAACLLAAAHATADDPATSHPFPGLTCSSETRVSPPNRLYVAEIDLANPRVRLRVAPGGPDPDGPGEWQTTLLEPTRIAARDGLAFVVNGDFFRTRPAKEVGAPRYATGMWAAVAGPAASRGTAWSTSSTPKPCLVVNKDGSVRISSLTKISAAAREVIAGNTLLVDQGAVIPHQNPARHPRTAVGLRDARGSKLVILVVDGRKPFVADGMSYDELAAEMVRLGCRQALNLDGGGSSVMAVHDPAAGGFRILNSPTDGSERPVANVLGIALVPPAKGHNAAHH